MDSAGWTTKVRAKWHGDRVVKILVGLAALSMCGNVLKQLVVAARRAAWIASQIGAISQERVQENNAAEMVDRSVGSSSSRPSKKSCVTCAMRYNWTYMRPSFLCSFGFGWNSANSTRASVADLVYTCSPSRSALHEDCGTPGVEKFVQCGITTIGAPQEDMR